MNATTHPAARGPAHPAMHRAWWSLLLFPVSFVLAVVVGEAIPSLLGYPDPSLNSTPWWVVTLAFAGALAVFAAPLPVTAHFCNKALAEGEAAGRRPLVVARVVIGGFVLVNLASGIVQLLS